MKFLLSLIIVVAIVVPLTLPDLVQAQGSGVQIPSPIKCLDVQCLVGQVIRYILGTIAIIATGMFVWGGIMMMTSAGNAEKVKKAKDTLAWALVGIVVIILSWAIIQFVLRGLLNPSSLGTGSTPTLPSGCCDIGPSCSTTTAGQCTSGSFTVGQTCVGGTTCQ